MKDYSIFKTYRIYLDIVLNLEDSLEGQDIEVVIIDYQNFWASALVVNEQPSEACGDLLGGVWWTSSRVTTLLRCGRFRSWPTRHGKCLSWSSTLHIIRLGEMTHP